MKRQKMMIFLFSLTCFIHDKVQEYNNLNRTAGRVPSTNTETVRHLELVSLEASVAGQD